LKTCPNCAWSNDDDNRFCENCGADLRALGAAGGSKSSWPEPPQDVPRPPVSSWETPQQEPDWKMAPLPSEEVAAGGRRLWIWLVAGGLIVCLAICVATFSWLEYTDSGHRFQTSVAEKSTEEADS
jgi:zinc-ribbon domain